MIYTWFRIRKLIAARRFRNIFTVFFLFLMLSFPLAETMSHRPGSHLARPLIIAGYYSLPLLMYLVLIVLLSDLMIGAARLTRMISKETLRNPRIRRVRLYSLLIVPPIIVILGILNYHHLRIHEYTVEVPRRSSKLERLKIAYAADFHLGEMTDNHFMEKFVAKINSVNPDIVLLGGDVLEGGGRDEDLNRFEAEFRQIKSKYGIYGVPGNHERYGGNRSDFFIKSGIRLLQDVVIEIDGAFCLAGRNDGRSWNRKSIDELLRTVRRDLPLILLDHRPVDFDRVSQSGVDIQLSGHTHHGQLFPLNCLTRRRYELSWGYKKKGPTHFFVTSGVQIWGPPVRTAGASEILVIDVLFGSKTLISTQ